MYEMYHAPPPNSRNEILVLAFSTSTLISKLKKNVFKKEIVKILSVSICNFKNIRKKDLLEFHFSQSFSLSYFNSWPTLKFIVIVKSVFG